MQNEIKNSSQILPTIAIPVGPMRKSGKVTERKNDVNAHTKCHRIDCDNQSQSQRLVKGGTTKQTRPTRDLWYDYLL